MHNKGKEKDKDNKPIKDQSGNIMEGFLPELKHYGGAQKK
jgi:hypothetical protein